LYSKLNKLRRNIIYTGYLLLIGFVVTEAGLRVKGVYKTYSERTTGRYASPVMQEPNNKYNSFKPDDSFTLDHGEFQYLYKVNSYGFRERDIDLADPAARKVLVFGDSFTEGVGAAYDSTWPRFLEHYLLKDSIDVSLYNFGVSGGDPFFNFAMLQDILGELKPSHVIFAVNGTDLSDVSNRGGFSRFKSSGVQYPNGPWYQHLFRWSHVMRYIVIERMGMDYNFKKQDGWPALRTTAADSIANCLDSVAQLCGEQNTKFLAMTHPMPGVICGLDTLEYMEVDELRPFLVGINSVHLSLPVAERIMGPDCASYGWSIDGHYNAHGYEILAEEFYDAVRAKFSEFWEMPNE